MSGNAVARQVRALYRIIDGLHRRFPHRKFTLDGLLLGSLGEVYAEQTYALKPLPGGTKAHDARKGRRLVQIKTTQRAAIMIGEKPEYLIALLLHDDGSFEEIYNGSGTRVWNETKGRSRPKNGLFHVSVSKLRKLQEEAAARERFPNA
jgi:hypothetical protein